MLAELFPRISSRNKKLAIKVLRCAATTSGAPKIVFRQPNAVEAAMGGPVKGK